jgi:hypothetical protein
MRISVEKIGIPRFCTAKRAASPCCERCLGLPKAAFTPQILVKRQVQLLSAHIGAR